MIATHPRLNGWDLDIIQCSEDEAVAGLDRWEAMHPGVQHPYSTLVWGRTVSPLDQLHQLDERIRTRRKLWDRVKRWIAGAP